MSQARLPSSLSARLFAGLSVYQDVRIGETTVLSGERDCQARWRLIEPYLPQGGVVLDVGSNFGWFGLEIVKARPKCVVVSAEADERSAAVQHAVLRSHAFDIGCANGANRVCLTTRRITAGEIARLADAGQRFSAVLCLNVLHWMRDHRELVRQLGRLAGRIFVEHPHESEEGAGIEESRREIGPIAGYLAEQLPDRRIVCLGELPSHRGEAQLARTIWMIDRPDDWRDEQGGLIDVSLLSHLRIGWPPRGWWLSELDRQPQAGEPGNILDALGRAWFTQRGLVVSPFLNRMQRRALRALLARLPETGPLTRGDALWRRFKRSVKRVL